ncbi:hypothetical protein ACMS09_003069 [Cronobacter malonaticus]
MMRKANQFEKISLYVVLLAISVAVVVGTLYFIDKLQNQQKELLSISFSAPDGFEYSVIPSFVYYNFNKKEIFIKGPLTQENEDKIFTFTSAVCQEGIGQCTSLSNFKLALVLISSKSDDLKNRISNIILYISLLGGALGSILRLFIDFVGNASYKDELDFQRWWPLYFTRPITGAILGLVVIILLKSNIISLTLNSNNAESLWWLGLSVISGFGTIDATERLRLTSKAIFGESKK